MSVIGHNQNHVSINSLSIEDREKLKLAIQQLNDSLTRVAAERDFQKETITTLFDQIGVDKKIIRRMAKVYFKANFNEEVDENKAFEEFYTTILK